ncbi:MAG: cytochrome c3 family protein [Thermodesulfobacteriota bacterium]
MNGTCKGLVFAAAAMAMLVSAAKVVASGEDGAYPQEEITISGKKPARFDHGKHIGLGLDCGACHHDANHEKLTAGAIAAMADKTGLQCTSCHNETFAKAELRERKNVYHGRCRECHQQGHEGRQGPTKCNDCHISAAKKKLEGC